MAREHGRPRRAILSVGAVLKREEEGGGEDLPRRWRFGVEGHQVTGDTKRTWPDHHHTDTCLSPHWRCLRM
jgi:hypothetical protein